MTNVDNEVAGCREWLVLAVGLGVEAPGTNIQAPENIQYPIQKTDVFVLEGGARFRLLRVP